MLPADPYRAGVYPPPGPQWPAYGNLFLKKAVSNGVSQDAHNAMVEKQTEKRKVLVSRLPRHGFAVPRPSPPPPPPPPPLPAENPAPPPPPPPAQGPQFFSIATSDVDQGTQTEHTHVAGQGTQTDAATYITSEGTQTEPTEQQFEPSVSKLRVKKTVKKTSVKKVVKKTAAEVPSMPTAEAGVQTQGEDPEDDDKATVNYGSDIADDEEMPGRASQKRPTEVKKEAKEKKPRIKKEPPKRPTDVVDKQKTKKPRAETSKVKLEGAPQATSPAEVPVPAREDDEVQATGASFNNNTDVEYWRQQSANELRAQLNLRFPDKRGDWNLKSKAQLVSIVRGLIKKGLWQQGPSAAPAASRPAPSTAASSSAPAAEDDEVKVTNIKVNRTTDMDFWAHQSMNEIRQQIALRTPHNRSQWAFLKRPELMAYIQGMMRDGTW